MASEDSLGYIFVSVAKALSKKYGTKAYDESTLIAKAMYGLMGADSFDKFIHKLLRHNKISEIAAKNLRESTHNDKKDIKPRFSQMPKQEQDMMRRKAKINKVDIRDDYVAVKNNHLHKIHEMRRNGYFSEENYPDLKTGFNNNGGFFGNNNNFGNFSKNNSFMNKNSSFGNNNNSWN